MKKEFSRHAAIQIDLATVHARNGEPEYAANLLSKTFSKATQLHLPEIARRIRKVRRKDLHCHLGVAAVRQLDEEILLNHLGK